MTGKQFTDWIVAYRKRFLGPAENFDFVMTWEPEILRLEFDDAFNALAEVALDPRTESNFPRQHLRLIVEHATNRREARERKKKRTFESGKRPPLPESWDCRMLEIGIIDDAEFERRQAARKELAK